MVIEVDLIWAKAASLSHIVLGEKSPYSLVAFLTSLDYLLFSGVKVIDKSNTPYSYNMWSCFRASTEVKTWVPWIEVTKAPLRLLLVDLGLENILEDGDLGLMVFTKALLSRSSSRKVKPNVGSVEDGVDLRSTGRRYVKGLIYNSNWMSGTKFCSSGGGCTLFIFWRCWKFRGVSAKGNSFMPSSNRIWEANLILWE